MLEIPNHKHQITNKSQIPAVLKAKPLYPMTETGLCVLPSRRKNGLEFGIWVIVICLLFGIWDLVLSYCITPLMHSGRISVIGLHYDL